MEKQINALIEVVRFMNEQIGYGHSVTENVGTTKKVRKQLDEIQESINIKK